MSTLLRRLLAATPRSRWQVAAAILLAAAASGSSVALMGVSAWLLSRAAEMPPIMYLNVAIVGVRAFGISRGAFRYVERLVSHDIALRLQTTLRTHTYASLARTTLLGRRQGDLLTRLVADVEAVLDLVVRIIVPVCSCALVILGTELVIGRFDLVNALALLATTVIAGLVAPWWGGRLSARADAKASTARGRLADQVHELERTATDLVAYEAVGPRLAALAQTDAQLRSIEQRAAWARGAATALQTLAAGTAVITAVVLGGQAVADGRLAPRLVAVLALTPLALHEMLTDLVRVGQVLTRAGAALDRVVDVLDAQPVGKGDLPLHSTLADPREAAVVVRDLSYGWPGGSVLGSGLSFEVRRGERLAIVGPSGAGKTTLAATLLGLLPPVSGEVELHGRVGYLSQDAHTFATSLAENVRLGNREATDDQVGDALRRAGLDLPASRVVGERGDTLSGGEMRRVALARVLIGNFDIFVIDEPTEHLDAETADRIMADLWQAVGDTPALLITHDSRIVNQCERVLTLPGGELTARPKLNY